MSEKCPLCGYDEFDHDEVNGGPSQKTEKIVR